MPVKPFRVCYVELPACLPAFILPKTSWIIQQLTHRRTTTAEVDGGDKDSTDNPGEIHSTQQPEDPSERTERESVSSDDFFVVSFFGLKNIFMPKKQSILA